MTVSVAEIRNLPKVELHAHLNGCIRDQTLFDLANERNVKLSERHFQTRLVGNTNRNTMFNVKPRSLQDCFEMFAEIPMAVNDLVALERITLEALQDFSAQNVVYLEIRSTPKRLRYDHRTAKPNELATKREYIDTVLKAMQKFESDAKPNMVSQFIVAIDRASSVEEAHEHVNLAIEMQRQNTRVVGVDLGGNPTKNDFRHFLPAFQRARESGLSITIHCAEVPLTTEERLSEAKAILDFAPDRLGHALLLTQDLKQRLTELQIPVETCPTSNVITLELAHPSNGSLVHGLRRHPSLELWLSRQHPLAVGTDDPGVFDTDASQELILLQQSFDCDYDGLISLLLRSMSFAFCSAELKQERVAFMDSVIRRLKGKR